MRVRFAPSPTGSLHVGGARTALYNYLLARCQGGSFVLRIEDTDKERNIPSATQELMRDLAWLGLTWDEGPMLDGTTIGECGPYYQSQRHDIYQHYAQELLRQGIAYYCFMQDDERQELLEAHTQGIHHVQSPYRDMPYEEAVERLKVQPATIRVRVPEREEYTFNDALRGNIVLPSTMVSDFVILRSCGTPVYNFCCVIDDHLMGITDVLRGEEHLPNTLKQLILYDVLHFTPPSFAHLSVIVGEDRKKLSKRQASVSVEEFRQQGFLPEALLNFLVLLGWSHPDGRDICRIEDMVAAFGLERVHTSSAYFDVTRLRWMNAQYLRQKTAREIQALLEGLGYVVDVSSDVFARFWDVYASDCDTLVDVKNRYDLVYHNTRASSLPEVLMGDNALLVWKIWHECLEAHASEISYDTVRSWIKVIQERSGLKGRDIFMPLRYALITECEGADVAHVASLLPRAILIERVLHCLSLSDDKGE